MNMNRYKIFSLAAMLTGLMMTSCYDDLNTEPLNQQVSTSVSVFKDPAAYKQFIAKLYGALTLTGQKGQFGNPEIPNNDEGETSFLRMYWSAQEFPTDECNIAWGGPSQNELRATTSSEQSDYNRLLYERVFINIAYCNEYIREVSKRVEGLDGTLKEDVKTYVAEARFLRALYYFYALDLWGNVPFITEEDGIGGYLPEQIQRSDLFEYIEGELIEIIPALPAPAQTEYARAGQGAAWMLLAKLYINAKVYTGAERNNDCLTYCKKIIASPEYFIAPVYENLFLADNHTLTNEIILPIAENGMSTQNYGGVTFIVHASIVAGGDDPMKPADYGIDGGWAGIRLRKNFVEKFDDITGATDKRAANIYTVNRTLEIDNVTNYVEGYSCVKFRNITSGGAPGSHPTFVDTDFPLFRLADVYLMYAEAVVRGGTEGDAATAVSLVNELRERAYGNVDGNISSTDLTLQFILDERARELYWEAQRRTDLIRFGQFTGDTYLWEWKGQSKLGAGVDEHYDLFPLPASDLVINTNLVQNPGY
jgi:hypothetical protein